MSYLTDDQIDQMADAVMTSHFWNCDWNNARRTAFEYSIDEFGIKPRKSAVLLAVKIAQANCHALNISVAQKIAEENER
tara:strand:+ start:941 stop:1177 length:237 start_codon:yes stop_codon:yes gene_type:complete